MFQLFKVEAVTYATLLFTVLWQLNLGSPTHWVTELYPQPLLLCITQVDEHTQLLEE